MCSIGSATRAYHLPAALIAHVEAAETIEPPEGALDGSAVSATSTKSLYLAVTPTLKVNERSGTA